MSDLGTAFKTKKGFKKIDLCTWQAREDDLQYCWVDTCCIDKSSSSELSEAINSMYAWYARSSICYIYLADVHKDLPEVPLLMQFENSRWFTRGWTLQELISPKRRVFFDANWTLLCKLMDERTGSSPKRNGFFIQSGTSNTVPLEDNEAIMRPTHGLLRVISRITGIAARVLVTGDIQQVPVGKKMTWVSKRQTTRVEDLAYCMMGIFNVNMPLLYGEGGKAFMRLQEEIIKRSVDQSIFYWHEKEPSKRKSFYGVLSSSPRNFYTAPDTSLGARPMGSYEMTNNGLRIQLPLIQNKTDPNEYEAILNVKIPNYGDPVSIYLRRVSEGQFARVEAHRPGWTATLDAVEAARLTWVNIQNFNDPTLVDPSYERLSRISLRNCNPDFSNITMKKVVACNQFEGDTLSFPYTYGVPLE